MSIDTMVRPAQPEAIAPIEVSPKQVPVISAAAAFAAIGAALQPPAVFGADQVKLSGLPRVLNGNIFRFGDGDHYSMTGYYAGSWIGLNIDRNGGTDSPIVVTGTIGRPVNLVLARDPETTFYTVQGQANGRNVAMTVMSQVASQSGLLVTGIVGDSFASFSLHGQDSPSAHYDLLGRGGNSTVSMKLDENGRDGSEYAVTGTVN